ncbi:hypothetical protein ACJIZ3_025403 [Penstemon smallii]|uniref:Uncharacterized protein n=1 Tax=Penstemon smallii TaxID=265156 RepID=A0ABD3TUP1_9LAMI
MQLLRIYFPNLHLHFRIQLNLNRKRPFADIHIAREKFHIDWVVKEGNLLIPIMSNWRLRTRVGGGGRERKIRRRRWRLGRGGGESEELSRDSTSSSSFGGGASVAVAEGGRVDELCCRAEPCWLGRLDWRCR